MDQIIENLFDRIRDEIEDRDIIIQELREEIEELREKIEKMENEEAS